MKKILLLLTCIVSGAAAFAQQPAYYKATIQTSDGRHTGQLERIGDDFVEISRTGEYIIIPAEKIRNIKLKSYKDLTGYKIVSGMAKGAGAGTRSWEQARNKRLEQENENPVQPKLKSGLAAEAPAYVATGAIAGALIRAIPGSKKSIRFKIDKSVASFSEQLAELKRYAVYNQLAAE